MQKKNSVKKSWIRKGDGRSLEWDKRVLIVLEKRKKLSLSSSPSLSLSFNPCNTGLWTHSNSHMWPKVSWSHILRGLKGWGTIFSLKPHALILFNHFHLFTKNTKISPIYYFVPPRKFLIGPQIFSYLITYNKPPFFKKKKKKLAHVILIFFFQKIYY